MPYKNPEDQRMWEELNRDKIRERKAKYYMANKSRWRQYRKTYMQKHGKVITWYEGRLVETERRHPFNKENSSAKRMRRQFVANTRLVCWWCGSRPIPCDERDVQVDHISSLCYISPRAVVCAHCNAVKRCILPNAEQLRRLFHDDDVLRDVSKESMKIWAEEQAKEIFGAYKGGVSLLLTKIVGQKVKTKGMKGLRNCETSESMCMERNIP